MKNKFSIFNFQFSIILLFVICCLFFANYALAISPAFESSPTAKPTEMVKEIEKIKEIREAVKEKVREKIEQVKKGPIRAYVGKISQISDSTLTLETPRGEKLAQINEETKIVGPGNKEVKLEDLKIGDYVITMGYLDENDILQTRRLVVIQKPKLPSREVAFGRVTDISAEEKILTVKNEKKGITFTVLVTEKTIITKKIEGKIKRVSFDQIQVGDRLVAVGAPSENEEKIITAKIIHVIPGLALGQEKPTISPPPKLSPIPTE